MYNDIESLLNENLALRKSLHLNKSSADAITKQLATVNQNYAILQDQFTALSQKYSGLQEKNKTLNAQITNSTMSFVSQIQQLKGLIEQKESELQNFQIKMIPTLDQDMLRVKIIAEMEGPYQEAVDKRDKDIAKLKDQIHVLKREKEMLEYSLTNKERELKKQIQQSKSFYTSQIDRLSKQLAHLSHKSNAGGKTDKQIIKSYRNQIDQLRSACQFHKSTEQQLRFQVTALRTERQKLLAELANVNGQKAVQISINSTNVNEKQVRELKNISANLEDQVKNLKAELDRLKTRIRNEEANKKKIESQYEGQIKDIKITWQRERDGLKNQLSDYKDELRKLRQEKNRSEQQALQITDKYKRAISSQQNLQEEISNLKIKLSISESQQTSRYTKSEQIEKSVREKVEREVREKVEKQIRIKIEKEYKQQIQHAEKNSDNRQNKGSNNDSPKKELDSQKSNLQKITVLQYKVRKLTSKLEFANSKIVELLKQKGHRGLSDTGATDIGRSRSISYSPQHDYHRVLLEHRDCSFVPLCPPVAVEPLYHEFDPYVRMPVRPF